MYVTATSMSSDLTRHNARLVDAARAIGPWQVCWLGDRELTRHQAITALTITDLAAAQEPADAEIWRQLLDEFTAQTGLTASDVLARAGTPCDTDPPPFPSPALKPFTACLEGWTTGHTDDWPNTVTVSVVEVWAAEPTEPDHDTDTTAGIATDTVQDNVDYADQHGERELVEIDTNYKSSRPGQYPVRLTRVDALLLAARIVHAAEDTFHHARRGRLRAVEAADVLRVVEEVDSALADLRQHALDDLLRDTATDPDQQDPTGPAPA